MKVSIHMSKLPYLVALNIGIRNPIALKKAKIVYDFGLSEYNRVQPIPIVMSRQPKLKRGHVCFCADPSDVGWHDEILICMISLESWGCFSPNLLRYML